MKSKNENLKVNVRIKGKWTYWIIKDEKGKVKQIYGRNFELK